MMFIGRFLALYKMTKRREGRTQGGQAGGCYKGPARGQRGRWIDGEDRLGFILMCIKIIVDICLAL